MTRKYATGRPLGEYQYGRRLLNVADVSVGDMLICDSEQFGATNLLKVIETYSDRPDLFVVSYAKPDGTLVGEPMSIWDFQLISDDESYFFAVEPPPVIG